MNRLIKILKSEDIFQEYQNTPIEKLIEYHNLDKEHQEYDHAELLVGMCMDNRVYFDIPKNFAYIMRTGGTNLYDLEFQISFAIGVCGIKYIAITGHTNCGMSYLQSKKEQFVSGLISNAGWTKKEAENHFNQLSSKFEVGDEIGYTLNEVMHLRKQYPKITIAPLFYKLEDNKLYQIKEKE